MLNLAVKRYILPFSAQKNREPHGLEVELAAVFALAEHERAKGGGLVFRQPEEKLLFISQTGYPLWLYPNNEAACIFDGLNNSSYTMSYAQLPTSGAFIDSLEKKSKTREDYLAFLSDFNNYFQQPKKDKEILLTGLIVDSDFKKEFNDYRKEATEATGYPLKVVMLSPILEATTISSILTEINKLQSFFKEDAERLPECLRRLNKTTSQFITELNYAAEAVADEANAKIKAQEELVNPQIAKINSQYKRQIAKVTKDFNDELENLEKLKTKTTKFIDGDEEKINQYDREAKNQAQKNHLVYEKRWKEKSRRTKKELDGLKKEIKRIANNIKNLSKQKIEKTNELQMELENEIKLARQPIADLETERDAKMYAFRLQTERLLKNEKPVIDGLNAAIKLAETANAKFEILGIRDQQVKNPALFYVPFYVACYQAGYSKRCIFLNPSMTSTISFSAKFKGALGISKIKQLFTPRFKAITTLIDKVQDLTKQDNLLDNQIFGLGEKNNLLNTEMVRQNIAWGLSYLRDEGWLSDKEYQSLSNKLANA
jgi:hypothetical protein